MKSALLTAATIPCATSEGAAISSSPHHSTSQSGLKPVLVSTRWQPLSCRCLGPWSDIDSGVHYVRLPHPPWSPGHLKELCVNGCFDSVATIKYDEKHFGKERVYSTYTSSLSLFLLRKIRAGTQGQNLEAGIEAQAGGARFTGLFLTLLFLYIPGAPGMVPKAGWDLPH